MRSVNGTNGPGRGVARRGGLCCQSKQEKNAKAPSVSKTRMRRHDRYYRTSKMGRSRDGQVLDGRANRNLRQAAAWDRQERALAQPVQEAVHDCGRKGEPGFQLNGLRQTLRLGPFSHASQGVDDRAGRCRTRRFSLSVKELPQRGSGRGQALQSSRIASGHFWFPSWQRLLGERRVPDRRSSPLPLRMRPCTWRCPLFFAGVCVQKSQDAHLMPRKVECDSRLRLRGSAKWAV